MSTAQYFRVTKSVVPTYRFARRCACATSPAAPTPRAAPAPVASTDWEASQSASRKACSSEAQERVKRALVDVYGDNVLALPKSEGINWVAYLVPIALIAALAVGLRRWRRTDDTHRGPLIPELGATDAARVDADLALHNR